MAEIEAVRDLRLSLAQRRARADRNVTRAEQAHMQIPSASAMLDSSPVKFALAHPAIAGLAVAALYLIGPLRLLRMATAATGIVQSALSVRSACQLISEHRDEQDILG